MIARSATGADVAAICRVCADGSRAAYARLYEPEEIERTIAAFYTPERVATEITASPDGLAWQGYVVGVDDADTVIAAGAGGLTAPGVGELFVLYADPRRRREGAGRAVLEVVTARQREAGAVEQWVSVEPGNALGRVFSASMGFTEGGRRPANGNPERVSLRLHRPL